MRRLQKLSAVFMTQDHGLQILDFAPMIAPFGYDYLHHLIEEGGFDVAQILRLRNCMAGATHQAINNGKAESGRNVQNADTTQRFDLKEDEMRRGSYRIGELAIRKRLQPRYLKA